MRTLKVIDLQETAANVKENASQTQYMSQALITVGIVMVAILSSYQFTAQSMVFQGR